MINYRAACSTCTRYAPSNPAMPPTEPEQPTYPFQSICADFFHVSPNNYLDVVDRYSQWLSIFQLPKDDSEEIVKVLRNYIATFGIPCTLTSDGASVFTSKSMESFCDRWGIIHRVATAYNPQANKRAEVGCKSAKRLVRGNLSQTGSLNTDRMARALLAHRNSGTPLAQCLDCPQPRLSMDVCSRISYHSNQESFNLVKSGDKLQLIVLLPMPRDTLPRVNRCQIPANLSSPSRRVTRLLFRTSVARTPANGTKLVL